MMKRILFVMSNLRTGGITTSLLNLLDEISRDKELDIDILLFDATLKNKLPKQVNVLPENKFLKILAVPQQEIERESKLMGIFRLLCGGLAKFIGDWIPYNLLFSMQKKIGTYDYAISCTQSAHHHSLYGGCNEFVLKKVVAKEKITFLHCDYINYKINTKHSRRIYQKFHKIAAVSESVKNVFLSAEPHLKNKVFVVHNCHNFDKIKLQANDNPVIYHNDCVHFLTVARLAEEKGHMRLLNVLLKLKREGYKFCWHNVGGADERVEREFLHVVCQYGLEDYVKLYHDQENPYRFFQHADALIVPSYHEAAPMVFTEAMYLGLPVISTNTTSAKEFIIENETGMVAANNEDGLYFTLKKILDNPAQLSHMKTVIRTNQSFSNNQALREFYTLVEK